MPTESFFYTHSKAQGVEPFAQSHFWDHWAVFPTATGGPAPSAFPLGPKMGQNSVHLDQIGPFLTLQKLITPSKIIFTKPKTSVTHLQTKSFLLSHLLPETVTPGRRCACHRFVELRVKLPDFYPLPTPLPNGLGLFLTMQKSMELEEETYRHLPN